MKYDLFVTDFDNTLGRFGEIEDETVSAIKEYESKGGKFVICTGRHYCCIKAICLKYGIGETVATCQGSGIYDIKSGTPLLEGGINYQDSAKLVRAFDKHNLLPSCYIGDVLYYDKLSPYVESYFTGKMKGMMPAKKVDNLAEYIESRKETVLKLIVWDAEDFVKSHENEFIKDIKKKVLINTSGGNFREIINPDYGKGNAVKFLANYYNIPLDKVITAGDAENDIPLIVGAWHGVAVGNASPELKAKAKEITVPFDEEPIKYLLQKYCL